MTVSVLVPFRGDGGHRDAAWRWVASWWAGRHPGWQVVAGSGPDGPWCKALAVADALSRADADVLVVADADVVTDGVAEAVAAVEGGAPWAVPHGWVPRLWEAATRLVYSGVPWQQAEQVGGLHRGIYQGVAGGGMAVLRRADYQRCPLDPRFAGWGQEDDSWYLALLTLVGKPVRWTEPLVHLWHEPAGRLNQHVGSAESHALHVRYQYAAKAGREAMAALVAEHTTRRPGSPGTWKAMANLAS